MFYQWLLAEIGFITTAGSLKLYQKNIAARYYYNNTKAQKLKYCKAFFL